MKESSLKSKQAFKWIFLSIMVALPEIIAFAPKRIGISLTTIFLVVFLVNVIFTLKNSFRVIRNDKEAILEEQIINKELEHAAIMMIIASLMIGFVLIKFIYSSYMSEWWSNWYTKEAMIIWWVAIEATSIVALLFSLFALSRKALAKMGKSIKKLIKKSFLLFKKVVNAMIELWKIVIDFAKHLVAKIMLSNITTSFKYQKDSDVEATQIKDQFLTTAKKATWPPLF